MAYGSSETEVVSATLDKWINSGDNAIDLYTAHEPLLAILYDNSKEPGGSYSFKQSEVAEGNQFKVNVFGKVTATAAGVTRANQVNAITPIVTKDNTNAIWPWTHYQGIIYDNYEDRAKNSGASQMIDLGDTLIAQIRAKFHQTLSTDLWDNAAGSISKIQSVNLPLANSGTVGGIDQTDTANNSWWLAQQDTTAESFNTTTLDQVYDACTFDAGLPTGISQGNPDIAFLYGNLFSSLRQQLKPAQRTDMSAMLKGGAQYLLYNGMRCYRNTRQVANTVVILNSRTLTFRFKTKAPEPVTPNFVPVSSMPSMWERGYNWFVGMGYLSLKHNGLMTNKTA